MESLQELIEDFIRQFRADAPSGIAELIDAGTEELGQRGIGSAALRAGVPAPDFRLPNIDGTFVRLRDLLEHGPVILTFYRGGWCPYCTLELRAYERAYEDIRASGASVVALSPQYQVRSLVTASENQLSFPVLSDAGNAVARDYGLVFAVPEAHKEVHDTFDVPLESWNGDDSWELPIPATYVIGETGNIAWANINSDYMDRAEPRDLLAVLQTL